MTKEITNPITRLDYPDPDIIRVDDTYYMVSTTMHFMPGCEILRSYDLIHWEHAAYVYDTLDSTPAQRLVGEESIYGKGMWAASLRYHKGMFYVVFVANDTRKTYLYTAKEIAGPWEKRYIKGFYHDCSLLFDDDERVYLMYGNKTIYLTELEEDLSGPKEGGLHRIVLEDTGNPNLGYEGCHLYKIKGKYYAFFIHSAREEWKRIQACFAADSPEGEFIGGDVLNDDMGYFNAGIAQGGIVDTPGGDWYAILFQDRYASGRIPYLVPVTWKDGFPVFGVDGKVPCCVQTENTRPEHVYTPLVDSDDFKGPLKTCWQWNHEPDPGLYAVDPEKGCYRITAGKLCTDITRAVNTLTQRMQEPGCEAIVTVDGRDMKDGDCAGISTFASCYGWIGLVREGGRYFISMQGKTTEDVSFAPVGAELQAVEYARVPWDGTAVKLRVCADFTDHRDTAEFYYERDGAWVPLGIPHRLLFKLDHFVGCRFALFCYAAKETGGSAAFYDFIYKIHKTEAHRT